MAEIKHIVIDLVSSGDSWTRCELPELCDHVAQVDIEAIDDGADDAGIGVLIHVGKADPGDLGARVPMKPIPADAVWELEPPHVPLLFWAKPKVAGTTPRLEITVYVGGCGCRKG